MKLGALRQLFYGVCSHKASDCRDKEEDRLKTAETSPNCPHITVKMLTAFIKNGGMSCWNVRRSSDIQNIFLDQMLTLQINNEPL